MAKGSTHDSVAWSQTRLSDLLKEMKDLLKEHGLFFVGDSAYSLTPYMIVPFPDAAPLSPEDVFNFWLSNSRIQIECTFGEFIGRFELFWRILWFDKDKCCDIIRSAALLHNFLVESREGVLEENAIKRNVECVGLLNVDDVVEMDRLRPVQHQRDDEEDVTDPMDSDSNQSKPPGRKTSKALAMKSDGVSVRDDLCVELYSAEKGRPKQDKMRYNNFGHVYFEE